MGFQGLFEDCWIRKANNFRCFNLSKTWKFSTDGLQNHTRENRRLGMIVTSFQDILCRSRQISYSFLSWQHCYYAKKWYKRVLHMGVITQKMREKVVLFKRFHFSTIQDQKPWKEGESGFPLSMPHRRTGQQPNTQWSVQVISRQTTSATRPWVKNISIDSKKMTLRTLLYQVFTW